jgi:hypothetical protein
MQSSNFTDEQWNKWKVINYVFTIIKNLFFTLAIIMKKDSSTDSMNNPYDEIFEKPVTPL